MKKHNGGRAMIRFAFVSSHPAPYRDAFLAKLCGVAGIQTTVFNLFNQDKGHAFWDLREGGYLSRPLKSVFAVVFGGYDAVCWPGFVSYRIPIAMILQILLGKKYGIAADTVAQREVGKISSWLRKFLIKRAHFIFVPGVRGKTFFAEVYNIPSERIITGCYSLDGIKLENEIIGLKRRRSLLRQRLAIDDEAKVFLMVANMISSRHYPITCEAFVRFASDKPNAKFIICGQGPELSIMADYAKSHQEIVVVPGCSWDKMKELYAVADVYVHGGTEPASTALIIGAIAHMPVVSSEAVGCSFDVVRDGETGALCPDYLSVDAWVATFSRVWEMSQNWSKLGDAARDLSRELDIEKAVDRLVTVLLP